MSGLKEHWKIIIECRSCGERFEMTHPNYSVDQIRSKNLRGPARMVLIGVPEVCPKCHNLEAAK